MQVFLTDMVKSSVHSALEHRPNGFHAVGMSHVAHVFLCAVIHGVMSMGDPTICDVFIRVNSGSRPDMLMHDALQSGLGGIGNRHGLDFASTLAHTDNSLFTDTAPASMKLLVFMLVVFFSSDVGFVNFDRTEQFEFSLLASFSDPVKHVPGSALLYA